MSFNFSDMGKIGSLMKNMGNIKEAMQKARDDLDLLMIEAESGAGDVKVTMTAAQRMVSIQIADHLLNTDDKPVLQDLIVGATQLAVERAKEKAKEKMAAVSAEMGIPLPSEMDNIL